MARARCRAHSLRLCAGSQLCDCCEDDVLTGRGGAGGPDGDVIAISMSLGRDCVRCGALKILRPVMAPPIRLPSDA